MIIAAVDFSEVSLAVAKLAARIAQRLGERLLLVHAVEHLGSAYGGALPFAMDLPPLIDAGRESMRQLQNAIGGEGGEIEAQVVVGAPGRVIENIANSEGARLIICGSHGRGAIGRLLVGSVAQQLLLRASCAVLVLRPGAGASLEEWLKGGRPLRVVVGVDRKNRATDATLDWMRQLAELGACDLTLVHEFWAPAEYARLGMRSLRDPFETDPEVASILERELAAKLGSLSWAPHARFRARAVWGAMGEALALEAEAARADLVVVGSEQPHGWQRVKRGSTALSALHAVAIPLLCVPAGASPASTAAHGEGGPKGGTVARNTVAALPPGLHALLAVTDFSEAGNSAVGHAFSLLRAEGGVVHLCHVWERALPASGQVDEQRSELERDLGALIPSEADALGIETRVSIIDGGRPAELITAAALRLGVDAIVLASRGRSGVTRALLGSVAEAVVRNSEIPVHVVKRASPDWQ